MCLAECWHLQGFVRLEVAQMPSKTLTTPLGVSVQKKCKWMYTWSGGIKTWNFETFWKDVCVLKPIGFALIHEALSCWEICAAFIPLLGAKLSQKRMGGKLVSSSNGFTLDGGQVGWQRGHLPSKNPMFNQFLSHWQEMCPVPTPCCCYLAFSDAKVTHSSIYSYFGSSSSYFGSTFHLLFFFEKKTLHFGWRRVSNFIICEQEWIMPLEAQELQTFQEAVFVSILHQDQTLQIRRPHLHNWFCTPI